LILHPAPFVNVLAMFFAVVLAPNRTDFVPLNEQKPCSAAHCVHPPLDAVLLEVVELLVPVLYQQLLL
jgi:hypothetical protein